MHSIGVIHGRFQIFHNDHLKYVFAGYERCDHLIIGITNPDPTLTSQDNADVHRSSSSANPLTYYERLNMVRDSLVEEGISLSTFTIVPFPINLPELYRFYVPLDAVFFLTIYDGWGEKKLSMFKSLGLKTEILWRKTPEEKGISASDVRWGIINNKPWEHLVPPATQRCIEQYNIRSRLIQS